jgi:hypothetical protein
MRRRKIQPAVPFSGCNHRSGLVMAGPGCHFISNGVDWRMVDFREKLSAESNK